MQFDPRTTVIAGHRYEVYPLPPDAALDHLSALTGIVVATTGAAIGGLGLSDVKGLDTKSLSSLADAEIDFGRVAQAVAANLKSKDIRAMVRDFAAKTNVVRLGGDGRVPEGVAPQKLAEVYDTHFTGRVHVLIAWLAHCLVHEYSAFFGEGVDLIKGAVSSAMAGAGQSSPGD